MIAVLIVRLVAFGFFCIVESQEQPLIWCNHYNIPGVTTNIVTLLDTVYLRCRIHSMIIFEAVVRSCIELLYIITPYPSCIHTSFSCTVRGHKLQRVQIRALEGPHPGQECDRCLCANNRPAKQENDSQGRDGCYKARQVQSHSIVSYWITILRVQSKGVLQELCIALA